MSPTRFVIALAAVTLAGTGMAEAQFIPINPNILANLSEAEHSADVPVDTPGGDDAPPPQLPKKNKNLPATSGAGGAASGNPVDNNGGGSLGGDQGFTIDCVVAENGKLAMLNTGTTTIPSGLRIRWMSGTERGYLQLNIDLQPGARASSAIGAAAPTCRATIR